MCIIRELFNITKFSHSPSLWYERTGNNALLDIEQTVCGYYKTDISLLSSSVYELLIWDVKSWVDND